MTGKTEQYLHSQSPWWQETVAEGLYFGDIVFDQNSESYSISVGVKVEDEEGNPTGVINAHLSVNSLLKPLEELKHETALNNGLVTYALYNKNGELINSSTNFLKKNEYLSSKNLDPALHTTAGEHMLIEKSSGDELFVVHAHQQTCSHHDRRS